MAVGLDEVLRSREARAARQAALLARLGRPLLSLTLVSPGPVKDSPSRRALMDRAGRAAEAALGAAGYAILERSRIDAATGPEILMAVDCAPGELKRCAIALEEGRAWGRLLDADVVAPGRGGARGGPPGHLGREDLGLLARRCLLCDRPARDCMAERRHPVAELAAEAERLLELAAAGDET